MGLEFEKILIMAGLLSSDGGHRALVQQYTYTPAFQVSVRTGAQSECSAAAVLGATYTWSRVTGF